MFYFKRNMFAMLAIFFSLSMSACDSDSDSGGGGSSEVGTLLEVDASAYDDYVYYNLETLEQVEVADPQDSEAWHVGFRRSSIILNSGDSGSGSTQGTVAATQDDFYSEGDAVLSAFVNADADTEATVFEEVVSDDLLEYMSDENSAAINSDWYIYSPTTHTVSANSDSWWIVRSGSGDSYAQFRVTDLTQNGFYLGDIDIELYIQGSGETAFSDTAVNETLTFDSSTPIAICYDIDAEAVADCAGADWDLQFDPELTVYLNSGVVGGGSGGAFGTLGESDLVAFGSGSTVPHWVSDEALGIFSEYLWYGYNLEGNHKLWPNYRVYIVDTGMTKVKAQILSYYNSEGTSGYLTLRVDDL